jgi:uncharacterized damage-inducible protein DinB
MATTADLLLDALGRVRETVHEVLDATPADRLAQPPVEGANTVAWLVWHLSRILDDHVSKAFGLDQVWTSAGWYDTFALPFPPAAHGYGHSVQDVLAVRVAADSLRGYHDAAQDAAAAVLRDVTDVDLDRIVDEHWDPPVTLAVRLVSVVNDCTQHAGQAAYARGMLTR